MTTINKSQEKLHDHYVMSFISVTLISVINNTVPTSKSGGH